MRYVIFAAWLATAATLPGQEFLERLSDTLTITALNDSLRVRLSGTFDLEEYNFEQPAPGLINSSSDNLLIPRLTLFLDAQSGSHLYFFAQARLDRGFDPSDRGAQVRLDEYTLRVAPWDDNRVTFQLGKFATVVGNFVSRHLSWDNPFLTAPLVYENVTALEDSTGYLARYFQQRLAYGKYEFIPVIWGPSYATGASISGHLQGFDYAVEVKNRSLSSRPETWDLSRTGLDNPTVSGRLGFRPNPMWNFGFSVSDGPYLRSGAAPHLPSGTDVGDYREKVLAQDVSFSWRHVQLWAEAYETRFEVPGVGDADTLGYYLEAKYKFAPQFYAAARWNQQLFARIDTPYSPQSLGTDLWRIDVAAGCRVTAQIQLKLQYSFQQETTGRRDTNHLFGTQLTVRF